MTALCSGVCASMTSLLVKLATSVQVKSYITMWRCSLVTVALLFNSLMWMLFVEASQQLPTSTTMVYSTGANILFTGVCGAVLLGEGSASPWQLVGMFLIVYGMHVIKSSGGSVDDGKMGKIN